MIKQAVRHVCVCKHRHQPTISRRTCRHAGPSSAHACWRPRQNGSAHRGHAHVFKGVKIGGDAGPSACHAARVCITLVSKKICVVFADSFSSGAHRALCQHEARWRTVVPTSEVARRSRFRAGGLCKAVRKQKIHDLRLPGVCIRCHGGTASSQHQQQCGGGASHGYRRFQSTKGKNSQTRIYQCLYNSIQGFSPLLTVRSQAKRFRGWLRFVCDDVSPQTLVQKPMS